MGCCTTKKQFKQKTDKDGVPTDNQDPKSDKNDKRQPQAENMSNVPDHPLFKDELGQATLLFYQGKYAEAAQIYRQYIIKQEEERFEKVDTKQEEKRVLSSETKQEEKQVPRVRAKQKELLFDKIDGLGQIQLSLGYYEWNLYEWYKEAVENGQYIGTVYDALSLCYLALKDDDEQMAKGIKWYQKGVDDYPNNHAMLMGFANILNNRSIYEEAIDYYNKVLDVKPKWVRPYECIAYIYEYKRIDKNKTKEICNKILSVQPQNRVALFIMARNQRDFTKKIQILTGIVNLYPRYARAINEIGMSYGSRKQYEESIKWYKQAILVAPEYASCYNNIGATYQMMRKYPEAMEWYFRCIEKDKEYKDPHKNMTDIFDRLRLTDQSIKQEMQKYQIFDDYFFYYIGLAYYDKGKYNRAIKYYNMAYDCAKQLQKQIYKIHNSAGITYDDMGDYNKAIQFYTKCIENNPKYHSAYYNTAIVYKKMNKNEQTIEWYKKAIEVNPRYSYAYNNLGNIHKNKLNYEEAIKCYKKAVQHNSTYTLALANMGICYLKLQNYRQAFNAMERAKECLPYDNNNLSQANRNFLKDKLDKFEQEGQSWRQNGCITQQQKQKLKGIIRSFQSNISRLYVNQGKEPINKEKILKPEILEIVRLVHEDQFELTNIEKVFDLINKIFADNEDYFHILPQLFMQYFYKYAFYKRRQALDIERELYKVVRRLSTKAANNEVEASEQSQHKSRHATFTLKHFKPPNNNKVNLFRNARYFTHYAQIYSEIMAVNDLANRSYQDFKNLVDYVKKQSYGILYGIGMKIPKDQNQQFKVILRIFEKMFKKQINEQRVQQIISRIDLAIRRRQHSSRNTKHIGIGDVIHEIMNIWIKQITDIVVQRKKKMIETRCEVSDLLRAKVMFDTVDHLRDAIEAVDDMCYLKGYHIIQMDNRLTKKTTQDVVFKIQIKLAVCELQLAMKQDETVYHFTHCIYQIERSPLGCIFGSYIFMSKGFKYPFIENCRDIVEELKTSTDDEDQKTLEAAKYIVQTLSEDPASASQISRA